MSANASSESLQRLHSTTLEAIARGEALAVIAERICLGAENLAPGAICTLLAVDAQRVLRPLAAPGLPASFSRALNGVPIGAHAGSCGTAAYLGHAVEVVDIATDPLWKDYKTLALPLGLQACWSSPIKARDGHVIGTFAFYYRSRRGPVEIERQIVAQCVDLCAIALEHDEVQSQIHRLAYFDPLTGLPNRSQFLDRAKQALATLHPGQSINVLHVDLEDFKSVNDTLGHRVGDRLLEGVARRLSECLPADDFIARLGGDEFALIEFSADGKRDGSLLAQQIVAVLDDPFEIDEQRVAIRARIGIATATSSSLRLAELSRRVELALREAKSEVRRSWCVFVPEMEEAVQLRRSLKLDLRSALDACAFTLVYQPIITLESGALNAVEALARWQHPTRGDIPPAVFIPILEEMGLIGPFGDWVLREACMEAARWPRGIKVGVNLSALQFRKAGFVLDVVSALHQAGLPAERLDLEVTESALLARDIATRRGLNELHDLGVRLSLDDFGTGYASLQSLRSFPFDKIKIDMSFVRDIGIDADSVAIIRAVIRLAHDLGIATAAEGVESASQRDWLARNGCTEGQGFYFSKPVSAAELRSKLEKLDGSDAALRWRQADHPAST